MKRGTHTVGIVVRIVVIVIATGSVQIIRIVGIVIIAGTQPAPDTSFRPKRTVLNADFLVIKLLQVE